MTQFTEVIGNRIAQTHTHAYCCPCHDNNFHADWFQVIFFCGKGSVLSQRFFISHFLVVVFFCLPAGKKEEKSTSQSQTSLTPLRQPGAVAGGVAALRLAFLAASTPRTSCCLLQLLVAALQHFLNLINEIASISFTSIPFLSYTPSLFSCLLVSHSVLTISNFPFFVTFG